MATTIIGSVKQRMSWAGPQAGRAIRASGTGMRGQRNSQARFTEADIRCIRATREPGKEPTAQCGATPGATSNIRKRRTLANMKRAPLTNPTCIPPPGHDGAGGLTGIFMRTPHTRHRLAEAEGARVIGRGWAHRRARGPIRRRSLLTWRLPGADTL